MQNQTQTQQLTEEQMERNANFWASMREMLGQERDHFGYRFNIMRQGQYDYQARMHRYLLHCAKISKDKGEWKNYTPKEQRRIKEAVGAFSLIWDFFKKNQNIPNVK